MVKKFPVAENRDGSGMVFVFVKLVSGNALQISLMVLCQRDKGNIHFWQNVIMVAYGNSNGVL